MLSIVVAQSYFFDMRVGDFGCITRLVFEFTGKVDYKHTEQDSTFNLNLSSLSEGKIELPIEKSINIQKISIDEGKKTANLNITFVFPIEVQSYSYFKENKNYIIVFDIYDTNYKNDKEKKLTSILFKGQKFPLSNITKDIEEFSLQYANDDLVNFYLGRLFSIKKENKDIAINYLSKVSTNSTDYFIAQAYIDNLLQNKFTNEEVKPDFLTQNDSTSLSNNMEKSPYNEIDSQSIDKKSRIDSVSQEDFTTKQIQNDAIKSVSIDKDNKTRDLTTEDRNSSHSLLLIISLISLLIIVFQFFSNLKKSIKVKELTARLENSEHELRALANKLEKGIIENSKVKDRMIIKLFNNGWKAQDIAEELSTSIEIVNATINKEGRL